MGSKVHTNNTIANALSQMVEPSHGRTTRTTGYWATAVNMSQSALYMKSQGERPITVHELIALTNATGDPLAVEALAQECGGIFLATPQCELPASVPLFQQLADTARQQSEALSAICEAVRDGVATPEERAQIDKEIVEMMASMSKLREMAHQLPSRVANVKQFKATM